MEDNEKMRTSKYMKMQKNGGTTQIWKSEVNTKQSDGNAKRWKGKGKET